MSWFDRWLGRAAPAEPPPAEEIVSERVVEAAASQSEDEPGYRRLTGEHNPRDLAPLSQDRMARLAEYLWQTNLMANRLVELPLAYLLAEGVTLSCANDEHQKLLDAFWNDPINDWPMKLEPRVRALGLLGEQCYIVHVNQGSGHVRLGYLDPRQIDKVVMDPDNPEQPIGVITKRDARGRYHKYRTVIMGEDEACFSQRTCEIRAQDFPDGECFLWQVNKLPDGSRGRSDLLAQIDWLDAYDAFLLGELDRIDYLRRFVWDVTMTGADETAVTKFEKEFKPPGPNSVFVHNDQVSLEAKTPNLQANDTTESARLFRNHSLGGATMPETWFGGGGDVNRAAASEMGEPTFKVYTARQSYLKQMLERIGRLVLWKSTRTGMPDWSSPDWQVVATFPELVNRDITKFAAAMASVAAAVLQMIDKGLLTEETGLRLVADVAARFGAEIDPKAELENARKERAQREKDRAQADNFNLPADVRDALTQGEATPTEPNNPQE